jgi:hypothetical protein
MEIQFVPMDSVDWAAIPPVTSAGVIALVRSTNCSTTRSTSLSRDDSCSFVSSMTPSSVSAWHAKSRRTPHLSDDVRFVESSLSPICGKDHMASVVGTRGADPATEALVGADLVGDRVLAAR